MTLDNGTNRPRVRAAQGCGGTDGIVNAPYYVLNPNDFDPAKEWITFPGNAGPCRVKAKY